MTYLIVMHKDNFTIHTHHNSFNIDSNLTESIFEKNVDRTNYIFVDYEEYILLLYIN